MSQWDYKIDQPMLGPFPFPNLRKGPGIEVGVRSVWVLMHEPFRAHELFHVNSDIDANEINEFEAAKFNLKMTKLGKNFSHTNPHCDLHVYICDK